jgi:hypothetical protein
LNLYYYKAWNLLFAPVIDAEPVSPTGTIENIVGTGPWQATITNMNTVGIGLGDIISAIPGPNNVGSLGEYNTTVVIGVLGPGSIQVEMIGSSTPIAGPITNIVDETLTPLTVQTNPVLQTWPEGYIYGSLHEYYVKRHSAEDAKIYLDKFNLAYATVANQNNLGKWNGGHTRLNSVWQPRRERSYAVK